MPYTKDEIDYSRIYIEIRNGTIRLFVNYNGRI